MAALLHCGPNALLDGTTAGAFHGLREMPRSLIQVTLIGRITAHRASVDLRFEHRSSV